MYSFIDPFTEQPGGDLNMEGFSSGILISEGITFRLAVSASYFFV
jgi:hypothetical protein